MAEAKNNEGTASVRVPKKHWYVVHTYTGQETQAKKQLEERIKAKGMEAMFGENIRIPEEKIVEMVKGTKKERNQKSYPGYILVELIMNEETWHLVRDTPRVTGFVGGVNQATNLSSIPFLTSKEVARLTDDSHENEVIRPKVTFVVGDKVRIVEGAFVNFNGVVESVDNNKFRLKVNVEMFGRSTPVEVEFAQAEKTS